MKLKTKLMCVVLGVVLFTMLCSTVVVYLLLDRQNRGAARTNFINTSDIIKDDLTRRMAKQAQDSGNMVRSIKLGEKVKFIFDFSGEDQFSITKNVYHEIVASLVQTISASGLWQMEIYDEEGRILAYAQANDQDQVMVGYRFKNPDERYAVATIPDGAAINDIAFETGPAIPFKTIGAEFGASLPQAPATFFNRLTDRICIETHIPVMGNQYNKTTDQMESIVVGVMVSRTRLSTVFAQHIAKLTKAGVHLFLAGGQWAGGTIGAYKTLILDSSEDPEAADSFEAQSLVFNDVAIGEKDYLQAALPLFNDRRPVAWISVTVSKASVAESTHHMVIMLSLVFLVCLAVVMPVTYWIAASFGRMVNHVVESLRDIAEGEGDLTRRLDIKTKDELGILAHWFNVFIEHLQGIIGNIAGHADQLSTSSTDLTSLSEEMASSAQDISSESETVATFATSVNDNITSIAAAMEQSSVNLTTVAASAEEMTATIHEIARNTGQASQVSANAVQQVQSAATRVAQLGQSALDISKVTETITEISEQTNLLALNATIEAARAGEAGKGFAVVANEIKELARQTSAATDEIGGKIKGIQETTQGTVTEIEAIKGIINDVNEIVATIASAVEEQSCSTKEIAGNVSQASSGVQEVNAKVAESTSSVDQMAQNLGRVNEASSQMSHRSVRVNDNTLDLSKLADQLKALVGRFRI